MKTALFALLLNLALAVAAETLQVNPLQSFSYHGGNDVESLQNLARGVGWEFEPDATTTAGLRALGIRRIRCINVELLPGAFQEDGSYKIDDSQPSNLKRHLATCRELGATPHIIVGAIMPPALRMKPEAVVEKKSMLGNVPDNKSFGPSDYHLWRNYYAALMEYVVVDQGMPNAAFVALNEPEIGGSPVRNFPLPEPGSRELYESSLRLYRELSAAAREVEARHPEAHITLGGLGFAWPFTFKSGDFNWSEQFLRDCAEEDLKLDFIDIHFYGNMTSLHGEYEGFYPSFDEMFTGLLRARDAYRPGLPIHVNEWGPSYNTNTSENAMLNADAIGAAWGMEFLSTLLDRGADEALYLVTTDLQGTHDGKPVNLWGWCSLFTNPHIFGNRAWPKPMFHVFTMIAALRGERVEAAQAGNLHTFAAADADRRQLRILVWNFQAVLPEFGAAQDLSRPENATILLKDAGRFFGTPRLRITRKLVDHLHANAYEADRRGEVLSEANTFLHVTDTLETGLAGEDATFQFEFPPSSVSLLEIEGIE